MKTSKPIIGLMFCLIINSAMAQDNNENQNTSLVNEIINLELDSLNIGYLVYYSKGYQKRARQIGSQVYNSNQYFKKKLGIDIKLLIALLDTADYQKTSSSGWYPYGLPFVQYMSEEKISILPALSWYGVVYSTYLTSLQSGSKDILANLEKLGYSSKTSASLMVDLVALHELGHAQAYEYGLNMKQPWFNEFLATYLGYTYMRETEPDMAAIWENVALAGFQNYTPKYNLLDDFNELYTEVGPENYVWFQDAFTLRVIDVYNKKGLVFLEEVKDIWTEDFQPENSTELLKALDKIAPGFSEWAEQLKK